jgi:type 1 fimbria pilin
MRLLFPQEAREGAYMKGWIRRTCMGCVVAFAFGVPFAHADGGTITFSGAVVEPTCSAGSGSIAALSSPQHAAASSRQHFRCGEVSPGADSGVASPSSYKLTVEPLESSSLGTDRLVSYFSGYVKATQADARMNLVTQAYE